METFYQILAILGVILIIWFTYRSIKGRPELFQREKITRSFTTLGFLGLILIAFVAFLVFLVRHT